MGRLGTRVVMPYVHRFKDRHGKLRHYYRRHGQKAPLHGDPGSPEFMADYAKAASKFSAPLKGLAGKPGTIGRLVSEYMASTHFKKLAPSSTRTQQRIFNKLSQEHGDRMVSEMKRSHVDRMMARMSDTPGAANVFLKRMKTLMVYAVSNGWITSDPTYRMPSFDEGEVHTWTEEEIGQFERKWPISTKRRLAFALHLYTGQRRSDVHRMTWGDIDDGGIWVTQQKTGTKLWIPLHESLSTILDAEVNTSGPILKTEFGKPFEVAGYGNWINGSIRSAGLPKRCVAHGLRKAAARRLAEAGCTSKQIAAITGHKTLAEVERYTIAADQKRMAKDAMAVQKAATARLPSIDNSANQDKNTTETKA